MRRVISVAAALLISAAATAARGQELVPPAGRQGYFLGGGLRSGVVNVETNAAGNLGLMQGGGLTLRFGQMASPMVGFGLNLVLSGGSSDQWTGGYGALSLEAMIVPMDALALRAGIGIGGMGVQRVDQAMKRDGDPSGTAGTLYTLGMSYDWFPWWEKGDTSGGIAFTPFFEVQALPGDGIFAFAVLMGIEATWWSGLEDNKLDLEPEDAFKAD